MNNIRFFFRLTLHDVENRWIYQSRGFETMRNLKISLTSWFKYHDRLGVKIYQINEKDYVTLMNTGNKIEIQDRLYNGRRILLQ